MISLELGELYGCADYKELMSSIKMLQMIGMSDIEIQHYLETMKRAKERGES